MRIRAATLALLTAVGVVLAASATAAATTKEYVLKHPKREHCKSHYVEKHKTVHRKVKGHTVKVRETVCVSSPSSKPPTGPSSSSSKPEECTPLVSGTGPNPETHLYSYQVILGCDRGEFGAFQVATNRAITAGSVTAQIGSLHSYTCTQPSSTFFSCSGVSVQIPPVEGAAIRAFFKSSQPPCEGGAPESATITTLGETFNATIGEAQGAC